MARAPAKEKESELPLKGVDAVVDVRLQDGDIDCSEVIGMKLTALGAK